MRNYITPFEDFGFEVHDGWLPIVQKIPELVEQYNRNRSFDEQIEVFQIKSKFGELRVYLDYKNGNSVDDIPGLTDEIDKIICKCCNTCEWCGSNENVTTSAYNGWIRTLCDKCNNELRNKQNINNN